MEIVLAVLQLVVIGVLILFWRSYFPAYLREKGKNLATTEDIGKITHEVEKVRIFYESQLQELQHRNDLLLEQLRSKQQLRMAALEKRLQAHKDAYMLWRKVRSNVSSPKLDSIVLECQQWWESNCLYLEPDARAAFARAYSAPAFHGELLAQARNAGPGAIPGPMIRDNFEIINKAGEAIVKGVELPTLGELETNDVTEKTTRET